MNLTGVEYSKKILSLADKSNIQNNKLVNVIAGEALNQSAIAVESSLIAALLLKGYSVNWIFCGGCISSCEFSAAAERRIFGNFVYNRVCRRCVKNATLIKKSLKNIKKVNVIDLKNEINFDKNVDFDESHSLIAAKRALMVSTIDPTIKQHLMVVEKMRSNLLRYNQCMDSFLKKNISDLSIFKHGIYLLHGPVLDWMKKNNREFVCWDVAYADSTILIGINDRYDHYLSKLEYQNIKDKISPNISESYADALVLRRKEGKLNSSIESSFNESQEFAWRENNNKQSVGIFANTLWDADVWYEGVLFSSHTEYISNILNSAKKYPDINFVFSPHPVEGKNDFNDNETLLNLIETLLKSNLPDNIFITDKLDSSYDIASNVDVCFVYGSSIGLELAFLEYSVYAFGTPTYLNKGIVRELKKYSDYDKILSNVSKGIIEKKLPNQKIKAADFIYFQDVCAGLKLTNLPINIKNANQTFKNPNADTISFLEKLNIGNLE